MSRHTRITYKKHFLVFNGTRMPNLSINKLNLIAKMRRIKGYKNMCKKNQYVLLINYKQQKALIIPKQKKLRKVLIS